MSETTFATGEFALVPNTRRLRGLVTPYGETGTNANGDYVFSTGTVAIPEEPIDLWIGHEHKQHLGQTVSVEETERGIEAEFEIDEGLVGDRFLAEYAEGKKHNLSAEFEALVREGASVVSSVLTGVAAVVLGGFASAAFFELDEAEAEQPIETDVAALIANTEAALQAARAALAALETPEAEEAAEDTEETNTEPESPATTPKEDAVAEATAPYTLTADAVEKAGDPALSEVFDLITRAKKGDESAAFALSDIKISGSGALPATGVLQPAWLGELWSGRSYKRKYMPLINNGEIKAIDEKGFVLDQGTALVTAWAGNKAEIGSGTASTSLVSASLQKWGYAADIAREFFDLPGGEEVINAFIRGVLESYAQVTDEWTLAQMVTAATANITAPDTYPSEYDDVFGQLIQGAEAIEDANETPSFAILNQAAWNQYKYTPFEAIPHFVRFAFNLNGAVSADAIPTIVRGDIGIDDTPAVIVGSRSAAHVNEKAGASPLQLDALDIANGGVDKAVVGYTQYMTERSNGLVLIGTADE